MQVNCIANFHLHLFIELLKLHLGELDAFHAVDI
jgi:hypothetical protein